MIVGLECYNWLQSSCHTAVEPLKAVGRIGHFTSTFRLGLLVPIDKKSEATMQGNCRPIRLLSGLRRFITKLITATRHAVYKYHSTHWGVLHGTNTEMATATAKITIHEATNKLALLYLEKPYDSGPRRKLLDLCSHQLSPDFTAQMTGLLAPEDLKRQGSVSRKSSKASTGCCKQSLSARFSLIFT